MATTPTDTQRQNEYDRLHCSPEIRAQAIALLTTLAEQYPQLRLGQILSNAVVLGERLHNMEDDELARALDQLRITFSQFAAAGIRKEQL
jgi:hypothetical protein